MKKANLFLAIALLVVLCTALFACGKTEEPEKTPGTPVSAYKSPGGFADLGADQLTWEGLSSLPQKYANMPTGEARQVCVDFWRYCKTALWIPDERYDIYLEEDGVQVLKRYMEQGSIYAGVPYVTTGTGSLYRLFDFMDPATGVVDISEAGKYDVLLGNVCSTGCFWAWARVMNSSNYSWSQYSVQSNNCINVGNYTYDKNLPRFVQEGDQGTDDVCAANGQQVIYESYGAMDIADGLVTHWEKNGHIMMCSVAPVVVRNSDGTIDGENSYLHIIEQGGRWDPGVSAGGLDYEYEYSLDKKFTFLKLWESKYIPFTFGEFIGTDPIEETEIKFTYSEDSITKNKLFSQRVTCNYYISDIYVYIYDESGTEVLKHAVRARQPSTLELQVHKRVGQCHTWGDWDSLTPGGDYTIKIDVQLGTGEKPVVYEGKFIVETDN